VWSLVLHPDSEGPALISSAALPPFSVWHSWHTMVKAFPPNRANHPLRIGVLPRRAWRNDRLPDVQQPRLTRKSFAIDLIPVPDQMPRTLVLPARLDQLSCRPFRRRVLGDIEMHQPAPAVAQHDPHTEHSK